MKNFDLKPAADLGLNHHQRTLSLRREAGLLQTAGHLGWWMLMQFYLRGYHRLEVRGRENLPATSPFVLVANHSSHLDALMLAAMLPWRMCDRVFPLAAGDVFFETPTRATFAMGLLNALPMWRYNCGRHALEQLRERLVEEPCTYILFPEGKRSGDGTMLPFKAGVGMLLAQSDVPVVPCYLQGAHAALPKGRRLPRPGKLRIHVGPPMTFTDIANDRAGWQTIAQRLREAVSQLSGAAAA